MARLVRGTPGLDAACWLDFLGLSDLGQYALASRSCLEQVLRYLEGNALPPATYAGVLERHAVLALRLIRQYVKTKHTDNYNIFSFNEVCTYDLLRDIVSEQQEHLLLRFAFQDDQIRNTNPWQSAAFHKLCVDGGVLLKVFGRFIGDVKYLDEARRVKIAKGLLFSRCSSCFAYMRDPWFYCRSCDTVVATKTDLIRFDAHLIAPLPMCKNCSLSKPWRDETDSVQWHCPVGDVFCQYYNHSGQGCECDCHAHFDALKGVPPYLLSEEELKTLLLSTP
jgi:hypothetical protein